MAGIEVGDWMSVLGMSWATRRQRGLLTSWLNGNELNSHLISCQDHYGIKEDSPQGDYRLGDIRELLCAVRGLEAAEARAEVAAWQVNLSSVLSMVL